MSISKPAAPDILSAEHAADPYETYRVLLEHYPVLYHEATNSWLVSRHADLVKLFRDKSVTSENYSWQLEPVHGKTILQMEGREHTIHRRLLNPFFHGNGLESFKPTIEKVRQRPHRPVARLARAAAIADGRQERGEVEIVGEFTAHFPINVIVEMLDLPREDHPKFERWYNAIMAFLSNLSGGPGADRPAGCKRARSWRTTSSRSSPIGATGTATTSSRCSLAPRSTGRC